MRVAQCVYVLCGQSKDATCKDYSQGEFEDVTSFTSLHGGCEHDGNAESVFRVELNKIYKTKLLRIPKNRQILKLEIHCNLFF